MPARNGGKLGKWELCFIHRNQYTIT